MNSFINMAFCRMNKECPSRCTYGRLIYVLSISLCCLILKAQCLNEETSCYCLKEVLSKLRNPIHMEHTQIDGEDVYIIAEQPGTVLLYNLRTRHVDLYLDLQKHIVSYNTFDDERGLLGFALHPNFTQNGKVYTYSIRNFDRECSVVSEIQRTESTVNERILLVIEQSTERRNGGQLLFGVDGYLYIFTGDGGNMSKSKAQEKRSLLGKVLRVDVNSFDRAQNYTIPLNNPFFGVSEWRPEIFALGVRNMWRCSVDRGDPNTGKGKGTMYCGDTGEHLQEEIDIITKGSNYGWDYREGAICHESDLCGTIEGEVLPIKSFNHSKRMTAIVGGPVYRGSAFKHLQGQYLYGDFVSGLFETNNEIQAMFSSMTKGQYDLMDLKTNKKLENHVTQVMFTLDEAISSLDDADVVINLLHTVGNSHRRLPSFDPQIFWKIEEPFLLAVKDTLGDRYTANMEHIYRKAIKFILQTLIEGFNMKHSECEVKSNIIPEHHDHNLTTTQVLLKLADQ
ncbi:hypothetical protein CHS0354_040996 [Potamilus streckersoni]|uniref:Globin domain-containing protein n=1 Tax=Potamilus streckersoni TaxID=2493646 RepID=A0AAE0W206_9BIVA|nr:hypothetical protein CHS0354_040996 [Potamilus streckersoni]